VKLIREESSIVVICPKCDHKFNIYERNVETIIRTPRDIYNVFMFLGALDHEELHVALLNTKNRIMSRYMIYSGNISQSLVRVSEVLREAVKTNAPAFVLIHNHPSGDATPSPDDLHLTAEVLAAARIFDIDLLDHVIVAGTEYVSLRDRGVSFDRKIKPNPYQRGV
jgi:DNA repair protein RadC